MVADQGQDPGNCNGDPGRKAAAWDCGTDCIPSGANGADDGDEAAVRQRLKKDYYRCEKMPSQIIFCRKFLALKKK